MPHLRAHVRESPTMSQVSWGMPLSRRARPVRHTKQTETTKLRLDIYKPNMDAARRYLLSRNVLRDTACQVAGILFFQACCR